MIKRVRGIAAFAGVALLCAFLAAFLRFSSEAIAQSTPSANPAFAQKVIAGVGQSVQGSVGTQANPIVVVDCTQAVTTPSYDCSGLGAKINSLIVTSIDSVSRLVTCAILSNGINYILFTKLTVVASTSASTSFSGFASSTVSGPSIDEGTNPYVYLTNTNKLVCWANAITPGTTISYLAFGGAF